LQREPDELLRQVASYIRTYKDPSENALHHARLCLADAMGCAMLALEFEECTKLLGPVVPGTTVPNGARVPGTSFILDPILAAFNFGSMVRWLDYNDTFLALEWAHPSDNLGALLPLMDYLTRIGGSFSVRDLLTALIQAYEIQGCLSIDNSFNRVGFDHVIFIKLAIAGLTVKAMGGTEKQIIDALSQVFIDTGPLRTYRHAPNAGSRKSWAAGDAAARGIHLARLTMLGEQGYATPLSASKWGLQDILFGGKPLKLERTLSSYIIENILFKISYPAEFHAQTAVEAALELHPKVKDKIQDIEKIEIFTHDAAIRIITKSGPLYNPADRDHCIQYMVACALLYGHLKAEHYNDEAALDPRIDVLREKTDVEEEPQFSKDYLDPKKRSISSTLKITFKDGQVLGPLTVEFPRGHPRRREEATPLLYKKLRHNLAARFDQEQIERIATTLQTPEKLDIMPIPAFVDLFLT
jgi:2-methylcitrate dehydratase